MLGEILTAVILNGNEKNIIFCNTLNLKILSYAVYGSKFISEVYSRNSQVASYFSISRVQQ